MPSPGEAIFVFSCLTHTATSNQETLLLCLYLALISSVLSPLNKAICTWIRAYPGYCNWLPSDWTWNVLLERMSNGLYTAVHATIYIQGLGFILHQQKLKNPLCLKISVIVEFICVGIHLLCIFYCFIHSSYIPTYLQIFFTILWNYWTWTALLRPHTFSIRY